ncbi:pyridoxamine 5'-phosphate oxidase [Streptomyces sp. NPDC101490]|uniref:pyridoxamine 5'-phosphate oxidase family protein n=1 Tax=Streptomyces sp. NPDC101490 TaxID=3366143 RepID=UPI00381F40FC
MTNIPTVRGPEQRKKDLLDRLTGEADIWVASASPDGLLYLVPLSFLWDGTDIWLCTRLTNPTGRNLSTGGHARLALGHTRDVVLLGGEVTTFRGEDAPVAAIDAFAAKSGWDPRGSGPAYIWFRVRPTIVEAWHEEPEITGRRLMTDGAWTV